MSAPPLRSIGELIEPISTWTPERDDPDGVFTYVDLSAIDQDAKAVTGARELACSEAPSRARQLVRAGDVLVSTVRPNLNGVALVPAELDGATASTGFCVLRPRVGQLDSRYLYQWVKSPRFVSDMVRKATGASYPAVSDRIVCESKLPLPSLPEQRRIAEILDKADALRAKRRAALAKLDTLTQSIFLDMFGDPATSPKGWPTARLGDLCIRITDGTHQPPKWSESGHPFLFVSNIISGELTFDTVKFISDETHLELTRRCPIEVGDVLYSTVGSYGVPALVRTTRKFAFQRHIAHLKPNRSVIEPDFLRIMLASPPLKRQADKVARGVAQKTVNLGDIRNFVVFKPSLDVQRQFASQISKIDSLRARHSKSLEQFNRLFATVQHHAFQGEL